MLNVLRHGRRVAHPCAGFESKALKILKEFIFMNLIVREASQDDVKVISLISVTTWKIAYRGLLPDEFLDSLSVEMREKNILKGIKIPSNRYAIAELGGQPVGMICFYPLDNVNFKGIDWEIEALYVLPQYWNKGVGRTLIKYAFQCMVENKANTCNLWMLKYNENARKFYERVGMSFSGKEKTIKIGIKEHIEVNYHINF